MTLEFTIKPRFKIENVAQKFLKTEFIGRNKMLKLKMFHKKFPNKKNELMNSRLPITPHHCCYRHSSECETK